MLGYWKRGETYMKSKQILNIPDDELWIILKPQETQKGTIDDVIWSADSRKHYMLQPCRSCVCWLWLIQIKDSLIPIKMFASWAAAC